MEHTVEDVAAFRWLDAITSF